MLKGITFKCLCIMKFQYTMSHWLIMMHLSIIKLHITLNQSITLNPYIMLWNQFIMLWNQSTMSQFIIAYLSIMNYLHIMRFQFTMKLLIITAHTMKSQFTTRPQFII